MTPSGSTSVLPHHHRGTVGCRAPRHIHALSDETLRLALAYLGSRDIRQIAQVCGRWRRLAYLKERSIEPCHAYVLPWNVLRRIVALLRSSDCRSAARVCVRWRLIARSFFSPTLGLRHINNLPAEIIDHALSFLDFEPLRIAAQVCVRWRDQGIEHPVFWKDVEVTSASFGSLELLVARLGQSCGRPCALTINIDGMHRLIETKLMGILTAIMPSVQRLDIRMDSCYILSLWPVLNHAAPQLISFKLNLISPDRIMPRIPLNPCIFDNFPANLKEVVIRDVGFLNLPVGVPIPAFSNICVLRIIHPSESKWSFPVFLFECCQSLERVTLKCGSFTYDAPWTPAALRSIGRLTTLEVRLDLHARIEFLSRTPHLDRIRIVCVSSPPDEDVIYDFLACIRTPINFGMIKGGNETEFGLLLQDSRSGYQRVLLEDVANYDSEPEGNARANPLLDNDLFPSQVQFVKVLQSLWDLIVPYLRYYTVVPMFIVDLDLAHGTSPTPLPRLPFALPLLETIILGSYGNHGHVYVSAVDVIDFVDNVLRAPHYRNLELFQVRIQGPMHVIHHRFDSLVYSDCPVIYRRIIS